MKRDLFKPESLLVFYLIFIALAVAAFLSDLPIEGPSLLSFAVIFITFPFYLLGVKAGKKAYGKKVPFYLHILFVLMLALFYSFSFYEFIKLPFFISAALASAAFLIPYLLAYKHVKRIKLSATIPKALMAIGLAALVLTLISIRGIPLLTPALKVPLLNSVLWGISMLAFMLGYSLFLPQLGTAKKLIFSFLASTLIFSLSAYRGVILTIFITGVLIAYYKRKMSNKSVIVPFIAAGLIVIFLGYWVVPLLDPVNLLLYRAGTTHLIFDFIVQKSWPMGWLHGAFFLNGNPGDYLAVLYGANTNLTYTMLGAAMIDFGIVGAITWMFSLGFMLSLAHSSMKKKLFLGFYPLLFTLSLIFIEAGVDHFHLLFFWAFLLLYMLKHSK